MILLGHVFLLIALIAAGYASFTSFAGAQAFRSGKSTATVPSVVAAVLALTVVLVVLSAALLTQDFRFAYVAEYASGELPWHYALSALWVGQAGSLLLWTWLSGLVALAYLIHARHDAAAMRLRTTGVLMAYVCLLTAIMVFAADPTRASLTASAEGIGLSPLLLHPAMLIHPPIIFLGYAAWGVPCALALVALADPRGKADWLPRARAWTLLAWVVLGLGIILGGHWAYQELGWGGYWAWDPVENGSLIPWLTGTALVHCLMAWQYRGMLKRLTLGLAIATFTLCNLATFLTRSGMFSSLHAFSRSPVGWAFLATTMCLSIAGAGAIASRWAQFRPERAIGSLWSREALVVLASCGLVLLSCVTLVGTFMAPLSGLLGGHTVVVGPAYFNNVLTPIGLLLLCTSGATPLLRWGRAPSRRQVRLLAVSLCAGLAAALAAGLSGERNSVVLTVLGCAAFAASALGAAVWLDARRHGAPLPAAFAAVVRLRRPQYAGYVMHLGFASLAVGIAGSSLGTVRDVVTIRAGESLTWSGYTVQLAAIRSYDAGERLIGDIQLDIARNGRQVATLYPAQHFHRRQNEWTTEVAVHSTWLRDVYTILHGVTDGQRAELTLVINPLVRWIWVGGWIFLLAAGVRLWPAATASRAGRLARARPKFLKHTRPNVQRRLQYK
ncbi:MAG: cytochrome c biogenesis protein CcsA [Pirellulaceae bacterium]|jgi:cytochrome c-type biogenesis protein CcmF|nr:cytochrome c biogenesis protein CcsA [Pirellulaceae bacterium]